MYLVFSFLSSCIFILQTINLLDFPLGILVIHSHLTKEANGRLRNPRVNVLPLTLPNIFVYIFLHFNVREHQQLARFVPLEIHALHFLKYSNVEVQTASKGIQNLIKALSMY